MNTHTTQTTHCFTLQQLRAATQAGGVAGVSLKAQGSGFFIQIQLRTGQNAVLVTARSRSPRMFKNPAQAFGVLKRVGIVTGSFDVTHYSPEQQQTNNSTQQKEKNNTPKATKTARAKKTVPPAPTPVPKVVAAPAVPVAPQPSDIPQPATAPAAPAPAKPTPPSTPAPQVAEPETSIITNGVQQSLI